MIVKDEDELLRIPQKQVVIKDTISGETKHVKPPDLVIEEKSKYRQNYFHILANQPKAFNKRKGEIT